MNIIDKLHRYHAPQVIILVLVALCSAGTALAQSLEVGPEGRFLTYPDGRPFFYLGDTAWELFHRLDREEAVQYLEHRTDLGFTVVQAVILAQLGGLDEANPYGSLPLLDRDPRRPNEAYFEHVDFIVDAAAERDLFVGMLPTWGSYWRGSDSDDVIFDEEKAHAFGEFLGRRYRDSPIIWILGGDQNIYTDEERRIIEAMAAGLREGDGGRHLMTFHPRGPGLSSDYFHEAGWLDFNMYQSSHGNRDHDNGLYAEHDYGLTPVKPTLDGEPRYETIPVGFYFAGSNPVERFDDYDTRQAAYWSLLAGACGHTFGHNSIWQMYASDHEPVIGAVVPWHEALHDPGARQMSYVKQLFTSIAFQELRPNQAVILSGPTSGGGKIRAATARDGSFGLVYSPRGDAFTIDVSFLDASHVRSYWFDPRYGTTHLLQSADTRGIQTFAPPSSGRGQDWILLIEDANAPPR